jgi:hypothetical protein
MMAIAYLISLVNPIQVRRCRSSSGSIAVTPASPVEEPRTSYSPTEVWHQPVVRDFRGGSHGFNIASFGARHRSISTLPATTRTRPSASKRTVSG